MLVEYFNLLLECFQITLKRLPTDRSQQYTCEHDINTIANTPSDYDMLQDMVQQLRKVETSKIATELKINPAFYTLQLMAKPAMLQVSTMLEFDPVQYYIMESLH